MRRRLVIVAPALIAAAALAGCSSSGSGTQADSSPSATGTTPVFSSAPGTTGSSPTATPTSSAPTSSTPSSSAAGQLGSLSAAQLLAKAKATALAEKSVKVAGTLAQNGESVSIDLAFAPNGTSGSVTTKGYKIEIIELKDTVYFRAPDAFFTSTLGSKAPAVLAKISGKWVKGAASDSAFASFGEVADKDKFFASTLVNSSTLTKTGQKTVAGVECVGLKDTTGTLYVAGDDARPIELVGSGSEGTGTLDFTKYGSVANPTAPPANLTVSAAALGS